MHHTSIWESLIISISDTNIEIIEENEESNIEYKLRLDAKNHIGLQKLKSQMNWRLDVGKELYNKKEAHYVLGINDNGTLGKIKEECINKTFEVFSNIVNDINATIVYSDKKQFGLYYVIYAVIHKLEKYKLNELHIAFVGPSQHGKTTTISHIVNGQKDNGNGFARNLILRHEHEKLSGNTSSIKKEIVGIKNNKLINYSIGVNSSWEHIVCISDTIINIIDIPGDLKYARTIFFGLCVHQLDAIIIIIDKNKKYSEELIIFYKMYAKILHIPYNIIYIDDYYKQDCYKQDNINSDIYISNITGEGINNLIKYLININIRSNKLIKNEYHTSDIFSIVDTYHISDNKIILSGNMINGDLELGKDIYLTDGSIYYNATIRSIQKKQIDSHILYKNESGALHITINSHILSDINKNMIITTKKHKTFNKTYFKILAVIGKELHINLQSLLFVENNIVHVNIKYTHDAYILELMHDPIIIINLELNNNTIAFIKNIYGYYLGIILDHYA